MRSREYVQVNRSKRPQPRSRDTVRKDTPAIQDEALQVWQVGSIDRHNGEAVLVPDVAIAVLELLQVRYLAHRDERRPETIPELQRRLSPPILMRVDEQGQFVNGQVQFVAKRCTHLDSQSGAERLRS